MRRWERYLEFKEVGKILWAAKPFLKDAWEADLKDPKLYPINTSGAFAQIEEKLGVRVNASRTRLVPRPKPPKHLSELIPEAIIKAIWEDNHAGTFVEALTEAANIGRGQVSVKKGWNTFQKIVRTIEHAYLLHCYGYDFLPKPKNSILHRGLDRIAKVAGLEGLTLSGFSEFLDDLCPCGLKNHKEAIRKMERRSPRTRRPRSRRPRAIEKAF